MTPRRRRGLRRSFFRGLIYKYTSLLIGAVLVLGLAQYFFETGRIRHELSVTLDLTAEEIARVLEHPLYTLSDDTVLAISEAYLGTGRLSGIKVVSEATGTIIDVVPERQSVIAPVERSIVWDGYSLGTVRLHLNDEQYLETGRQLIRYVVGVAVVVFTVSFLVARFLLIRPVTSIGNTLIEGMRRIVESGYTERLEEVRFEDFNIIAKSVNSMVDRIAESTDRLLDANRALEDRVAERTSELQQSLRDLNRTQAQLINTEKMASLGSMVRGMAHELNTPLGIALTGISFLQEQSVGSELDESGAEAIRLVRHSLDRANVLVREMRHAAQDLTVGDAESAEVCSLIGHALTMESGALERAGIVTNVACSSVVVRTHVGALQAVFQRLIANVIQHGCRDGGEMVFECRKVDGGAQVVCRDNGVGMDDESVRRAFEPFFTTERKSGNTGLGLYLAYSVIKHRLGGEISLESTRGKGTRIEMFIPDMI